MLSSLGLSPSFGFGDRLGLATPGHIAALQHSTLNIQPVFAQQSVRENARTGRTPQQVMDDAKRAVEAAGWDKPWGADADHLKTVEDLPVFVEAVYLFYGRSRRTCGQRRRRRFTLRIAGKSRRAGLG